MIHQTVSSAVPRPADSAKNILLFCVSLQVYRGIVEAENSAMVLSSGKIDAICLMRPGKRWSISGLARVQHISPGTVRKYQRSPMPAPIILQLRKATWIPTSWPFVICSTGIWDANAVDPADRLVETSQVLLIGSLSIRVRKKAQSPEEE
jgi:hypothetical protein